VLPSFKVIEESGILPHYMLSHELGVGLSADAPARYHVDLGVGVARPVWPTPLSALSRGRDRRRPGRASGFVLHHQVRCACLAIDRHLGTIDVVPDLDRAECDQQAENNPQGWQQAHGHAFEDAHPLALGKRHDDRENPARGQIGYREYHQSHPPNRKVV
jgi:hypothetical protein